jgi:hypothetical protein
MSDINSISKLTDAQKKASAKYRLNNKDKINAQRNKRNYEKKHQTAIVEKPDDNDLPSDIVEPQIIKEVLVEDTVPVIMVNDAPPEKQKRIRKTKKE